MTRFDTDKYGYLPYYLERVKDPKRILEVGVKTGGSLLLWCETWKSLDLVVGIDVAPPEQALHPKITVFQGDQSDATMLDRIGRDLGPFDVVIDDASHLGMASYSTFQALWPHVASGGLYVVEDWGTGYWEHWPDGEQYPGQDAAGTHCRHGGYGEAPVRPSWPRRRPVEGLMGQAARRNLFRSHAAPPLKSVRTPFL